MKKCALVLAVIVVIAATTAGCQSGPDAKARGLKVIVLGFDGLDYGLTKELMEKGRLPNFSKMAKSGSFGPLETSVPPQSPVAWSDFMTGLDSGGHGIFDFLHRDADTMIPFSSTSQPGEAGNSVTIGEYQFPSLGRRPGAVAERPRVLGGPREPRNPDDDPAHARKLPSFRNRVL